ncbi:MAG: glucose-1-phosphate adenylyltransferase [Candidatus Omnitrophica bacterium]|nr:glucose-1-phosphate adenylyltransferase [Candidatus Omnitrophota bacterium]MBU1127905.1 glucose-1-phosphate adenylyltransferase [Candidatus Omnitrophota bacterium]MBU1784589.1 glucose-1-phosphate adenylyltransferase [Candidatus Omnitrophota bacterium]MBU1850916.1 glucose-1-phosphate adenylyltransferase [Candidatus Omnitrophota bacterium]
MKEVLCVILGGGRGTRLYPLTKERCKPAVPLFGKHRLIDIPISNCLNSDLKKIYVLTQFKSESLNKHISRTYKMDPFSKGFVEVMAAEQSSDDKEWFQGTADAVRRCLKHFNDPDIRYVIVLSGDQLYKLNLRDVIKYHVDKEAKVTIACNRVKLSDAGDLGVMEVDPEGRIKSFVEKPQDAALIKKMVVEHNGNPACLGSMGIYMFNKDTLIELLTKDYRVDFGREIIPDAIATQPTYAFTFEGYWKDIGTIKTFYEENLMLTEPVPPLNMFDESWQIFTRPRYLPPAKFENSHVERSIISEGAIILSAEIIHSIIGLRLRIGTGTVIRDTIAMGSDYYETADQLAVNVSSGKPMIGIGTNCQIERAILDKNVRIGDNVKILNKNKVQHFDGSNYCIRDGVVIVSKQAIIPSGTII